MAFFKKIFSFFPKGFGSPYPQKPPNPNFGQLKKTRGDGLQPPKTPGKGFKRAPGFDPFFSALFKKFKRGGERPGGFAFEKVLCPDL